MNGFLNAYKPKGPTSHDVVDEIRRKLRVKKVGHAGTLDPFARGVLVIGVGRKATRVLELLKDRRKIYWVKMRLGLITETFDITGEIVEERVCSATEEKIEKVILGFKGEYLQVPPAYSAKKYRGRKLYELAREGKIIRLPPRKVKIFRIWDIEFELPFVSFRVEVSPGTYIRSLCMDIGYRLGCGAVAVDLVRECVGEFHLKDSVNPFQLSPEDLKRSLIDLERVLDFLPGLVLKDEGVKRVLSGTHPFLRDVLKTVGSFSKGDTIKILNSSGEIIAIAKAERSSGFLETLLSKGRDGKVAKLEKVLGV